MNDASGSSVNIHTARIAFSRFWYVRRAPPTNSIGNPYARATSSTEKSSPPRNSASRGVMVLASTLYGSGKNSHRCRFSVPSSRERIASCASSSCSSVHTCPSGGMTNPPGARPLAKIDQLLFIAAAYVSAPSLAAASGGSAP